MKTIIRKRVFEKENYFALFANGETLRFYLRDKEPMTPPPYPELYDISINNKCAGGCSYCYANAKSSGKNYKHIIPKIREFFEAMSDNEKPFQIAVGGAGEPTQHPDFVPFMEAVADMGIVANYTTNGMVLTDKILQCAAETCGGVAVSVHNHLPWAKAVNAYAKAGARTNLHIIIGERGSTDKLKEFYNLFREKVDYFVLLPYIAQGRAQPVEVSEEFDKMFNWIKSIDYNQMAFGAYFFDEIRKRGVPAYTYDIHMFSKYLDMDKMTLFESSYHGTRN